MESTAGRFLVSMISALDPVYTNPVQFIFPTFEIISPSKIYYTDLKATHLLCKYKSQPKDTSVTLLVRIIIFRNHPFNFHVDGSFVNKSVFRTTQIFHDFLYIDKSVHKGSERVCVPRFRINIIIFSQVSQFYEQISKPVNFFKRPETCI